MQVACFGAYFVTAANFLGLYVRSTFNLVQMPVENAFMLTWHCLRGLLSLPLSNADVERQVNIIKSKTRNRMISSTLSGILHVRYGMKRQGICCTQFTPTSDMLKGKRFNVSR